MGHHLSLPRFGWVLALCAALLAAGCIADQGASGTLSAADGSGGLVIYLVVEDGKLVRGEAWWEEQAPNLEAQVPAVVPGWEALVLKNDVLLERAPVLGEPSDAFFIWRSSQAEVVANPGDDFEVLLVNTTTGGTVASYGLGIST